MTEVKLMYFASLGDSLGRSEESVAIPGEVNTINLLKQHLAERGTSWRQHFEAKTTKCAVNEALATADYPVSDGDEIAFFPPMTGG